MASGRLPISNCLLCDNELEDEKPFILEGDSEDQNVEGELARFKEAFNSFCQLLKINVEKNGIGSFLDKALTQLRSSLSSLEGGENKPWFWGIPCCGDCRGGLEEIVSLQKTIDEMKVNQMECVEKLKNSLLSTDDSHFNDKVWSQIRRQLMSGILKTPFSRFQPSPRPSMHRSPPVSSRRIPNILRRKPSRRTDPVQSSTDEDPSFEPIDDPDPVIDTTPEDIHLPTLIDPLHSDQDFNEDDPLSFSPEEAPIPKKRRRLLRKSSANAPKKPQKQSSLKNKSPPLSEVVQPCSVVLQRLPIKLEEQDHLESPPEVPTSTRRSKQKANECLKRTLISDSPSPSTQSPNKLSRPGRLFSLITDNILMHKTTLIKISRGGTQFSCMEPGCGTVFWDPNSYKLFQKFDAHVEKCHPPTKIPPLRTCPICQEEIRVRFRSHLIVGHGLENVACESCWKPIRNVGDYYRRHIWSHMSEEEQSRFERPKRAKLDNRLKRNLGEVVKTGLRETEGAPIPGMFSSSAAVVQKEFCGQSSKLTTSILKVISSPKVEIVRSSKTATTEHSEFTPKKEQESDNYSENEDSDKDYVPSGAGSEPENDNDDDYVPSERQRSVKKTSTLKKSSTKNNTQTHQLSSVQKGRVRKRKTVGVMPNHMVWKVTDQILLYKFTMIKVSQGFTHFKCLEEGCSFEVHTFDFFMLFETMKKHIDTCHFPFAPSADSLVPCPHPGCDVESPSGQDFRAHLAYSHILEVVFCEVCWKPIRNLADNYRVHKWSHLGADEQTVAEIPSKIIYNARYRKKINMKYLAVQKLKRLCIKPESKETHPPDKEPVKKPSPPPTTKQAKKKKKKPPKQKKPKPPKIIIKANEKTVKACLRNEFFLRLRDDLLLYKFTVIKITPERELSCTEPDCSFVVTNGTDTDSYTALEEIKKHVNECHITENRDGYIFATRKCPLCEEPKVFKSGPAVRGHLLKSHGDFRYVCQSCSKPLKHVHDMKHHVLSHRHQSSEPVEEPSSNWKYVCSHCGRKFRTYANLYNHEPVHLPKSMRRHFSCPYCSVMLMSKVAVRIHVERIHRPDLKKMRYCPFCNQGFYAREGYKFNIHMRIHRDERPYVCDVCGKGFRAPHLFRKHQKDAHSDERRYQCEYCEMNYKYPNNLKRHKGSAHKDKLPEVTQEEKLKSTSFEHRPDFIGPKIMYSCEICEKVFPLRSRMMKHVKLVHEKFYDKSDSAIS